jgi:ubiquinol-cytochrome c reductase cytochrome c1 subunit
MKRLIGLMMLLAASLAFASSGVELDSPDIDLEDTASLKRGGELFATYCQGCHSAKYMRYSRIASDLGLAEEVVKKDLIVGPKTIHDSMTTAMDSKESAAWFLGISPPDLSLIARSRGTDWLYSYLRSFYIDPSRPFGVNNTVYPDVAMPNVLWELQGHQKAVFSTEDGGKVFAGFEHEGSGRMTPGQFDRAMADLVNFLDYVGEPSKLQRIALGKYVILFLLLFVFLAYLLKKEYWKDIH